MFNLWKNSRGGTNLSTYNILSQNKNTRIQKLNARATAISLNSIDEKVRSLEGTSRTVPIDMKSLDDRINNLISTAKSWEIVTLKHSNGSYPFDSKYANWNWIVLTGKMDLNVNGYCNRNHNSFSSFTRNQKLSGSWSKSGNSITDGMNYTDGRTLTVLFYK